MTTIELLRQQFKNAHDTQEATMSDVTSEVAHFTNVNKALPVGAAYAHSVLGEDVVVATMLAHTTPLSADNTETGLSAPMPSMEQWSKHEEWAMTVKVDLAKLHAFAQKVYKATDDYLVSLKETDLTKEIEIPGMGKQTVLHIINNFLLLHTANLTGEISAAKGFQGLKGYPW